MPSIISAGTTAGTAIAIAGDTTGNLAFQTNGTTTAVTIDTSQNTLTGGLTSSPGQADPNATAGQVVALNTKRELRWWNTNASIYGGSGGADDNLYYYSGLSHIFRTATVERMRIDASGRVTTPTQPYCLVTPPGNFSIPAAQEVLISGTWIANSNIGNNFNTSGGIFTAPVAGVYEIVWTVFFNGSSAFRMDAFIYVNGTIFARKEQQKWATNSNNNSSQIVATLLLAANDQVRFGVYSSSATTLFSSGQPWQYASVYLLG